MHDYQEQARDAFYANDTDTFNTLTAQISTMSQAMAASQGELQQYRYALEALSQLNGDMLTSSAAQAPMIFVDEQQYQLLQEYRAEIESLKADMADATEGGYDDSQLVAMQDELITLQQSCQQIEQQAQQTAAALGSDLGGQAADAQSKLYQLNTAVTAQQQALQSLSQRTEDAAQRYEELYSAFSSGDASVTAEQVQAAAAEYQLLSQSVQTATTELANLQAQQAQASQDWSSAQDSIDKYNNSLNDSGGFLVSALGGMENYKGIISALPQPLQGAINGISGMTSAAMKFIATPLGAIIAAIVLALQTLKSWFEGSAEGQRAFAEVSGYVSGVLGQLKEIVYAVGKAIYNAFKDPQKAVKDLWTTIKQNIVNRIEGLGGIFSSLGKMISAAFSGNLDDVNKEFKNFQENLTKAVTGVDHASDKLKSWVSHVGDAAKATSELSVREHDLARQRSQWQAEEAKLDAKIAEQRTKMYTGTAQERKAAAKAAEELINQKYDKQQQFAQEEYDIIKTRNSLTTNSVEDYEAEEAAQARLLQVETQRSQAKMMFKRREASADKSLEQASKKAEQQAQKAAEAQLKINETLAAMRDANALAEIELMADGSDKEIAKIDNAYQKVKTELMKKRRELAKLNRTAGVTAVNAEGLTEEQVQALNQMEQLARQSADKQREEALKADAQAMRDYLEQYGTFQQQKLAIAQTYAEKIAKATSEGQRLSLERERDAKLQQVDTKALQQQIDWSKVFGSLAGVFQDQLRDTYTKLQQYTHTEQFASSTAEEKKTVYDAMENIRKELGGGEGTLNFAQLKQQVEQVGLKMRQLQTSQQALAEAQQRQRDAQQAYTDALKTGDAAQIHSAELNLQVANTAVKTATDASNSIAEDLQNLNTASRDTIEGLQGVAQGLSQLKSGSLQTAFEGLKQTMTSLDKLNIGGAVGQAISTFAKTLSNAGIVGEIISAVLGILDVLKDGIGTLIASLVDTAFNAVNGILKDVLSGKFAVDIFNSLKDGLTGTLDALSFGGFSSLFHSSNAQKVQDREDELVKSQDRLASSIDELKKAIDKQNGTEAINSANTLIEAQKQNEEIQRQRLANQMSYSGAHHSNAYYWNMSASDIAQVNSLLGTAISGTWQEFMTLTADQFNQIRTYLPNVWSTMLDMGYYDKSEYFDSYADVADSITDAVDTLNEKLMQVSFDDVRSTFVSTLMDMTSDASTFADDFSKMMMQAMLEFQFSDLYETQLKDWYESAAALIEKENGELTEAQIASLQSGWNAIVQNGIQLRDTLADITGYDEADSVSATSATMQSMSQDTGEEIAGRMTALQIAVEASRERDDVYVPMISEQLTSMYAIQQQIQRNVAETIDIQQQSAQYLAQITQYTSSLPAIQTAVEKIEKVTRNL
jgi:hypothetical protein